VEAPNVTSDLKVMVVKSIGVAESSGASSSGPGVAQSNATLDPKVAVVKSATTVGSSGAGGGGPGAAQADATPDPKVATKRPTASAGSGGSCPPCKCFLGAWTCQGSRYVLHF
jgi:hypothetical protein